MRRRRLIVTIIVVEVSKGPALDDHVVLHLEDIERDFADEPFGDGKIWDCAAKGDVAVGGEVLCVDDKGAESDTEDLVRVGLESDSKGLALRAKVWGVVEDPWRHVVLDGTRLESIEVV